MIFFSTPVEQQSLWTLEAGSGNMAGLQRCCLPPQRENSCRQNSNRVEAAHYCRRQQKGFFFSSLLTASGEPEITLFHYLMRVVISQTCLMQAKLLSVTLMMGSACSGAHSWRTSKTNSQWTELVWDLLLQLNACTLNACTFMRPNGIHPKVPKELADNILRLLSILFQ